MEKIKLAEKFARFSEQWQPKIVGGFDDYDVKIAKIQGEFVWHSHPDEDELFMVVNGRLTIHFRDRDVELVPGEFLVVPKGVEHKPSADEECQILMIERKGTLNTGDAKDSGRTAQAEYL
jgi:mannose-6-phosphate isomerase-like protein (cupin superfamily)